MKPHEKGNLGEAAATVELLKQGYNVYQQVGSGAKVDLISEKNGKLCRIQVKYCVSSNNTAKLYLRKSSLDVKYKFHYQQTDADFFALYVADRDVVLFISTQQIFANQNKVDSITFRFEPALNNQGKWDYQDFLKMEG